MKRIFKEFVFIISFVLFLSKSDVIVAKTYRITSPTNLHGETMVLKNGSKIVFKKNGCLINGTLQGEKCKIVVKCKSPIFKDLLLKGEFNNTKSYLSWWYDDEDVSDEVESLLTAFKGTIFLDKPGTLTRPIVLNIGRKIIVDGCGNTFKLKDVEGVGLWIKETEGFSLNSANFSYESSNSGGKKHVGVLRIGHGEESRVILCDVSIYGFDNSPYTPCGMSAIQIDGCNRGTETIIHDVIVKDMVVKGDGREKNGVGSNYAISIDCHEKEAGKVEIYNCHISNLCNVDSSGNKIFEDSSGIYLGGAINNDINGSMIYCDWNASIHNCYFTDVSKRNIKIQGNYVTLRNLYSRTSDSFLKSYQNMYVGINGDYISIDGINGQYDGAIVKMTGDHLTLRNMDCTSALRDSKYAHVIRLDGTLDAVIEDCKFDNDTYMFIYPTERNMTETTVPEFHIKRCKLNVKNLLYCITNYTIVHNKGVLTVEDSDITLSESYVSNSKSLAEIKLLGTKIKGKARMVAPKASGGPRLTTSKSEIIEQ